MSIQFNGGSNPSSILYNGNDVSAVYYNGTKVWPEEEQKFYFWFDASRHTYHLAGSKLTDNYIDITTIVNNGLAFLGLPSELDTEGKVVNRLSRTDLEHIVIEESLIPNSIGGWFCNAEYVIDYTGLDKINTSNCTTFIGVFDNNRKITTYGDQLKNWDTSKVTQMTYMFDDNASITSLDISGWNTQNLKYTGYMFFNMYDASHIYVGSGWTVNNVTSSGRMFDYDTKLPNYDSEVTDKTRAYVGGLGYLETL